MRLHAPWFKHTHAYQSSDTLLLLFLTESKRAWLTDSCCLLASCGTSVNTVLWGQSDPVWFKQSRNLTSHDSYLHTVASFLFRWSVLVNAGCKGVKNVSHSHCKTHTHTHISVMWEFLWGPSVVQRHISHRCSNSKSFDCKTELEQSFTAACKSCGCLAWVGGELLLNKEKCLILITDVVSLHTEKDMKEKRVIVQRCSNVQFKGKKTG